MPQSYFDRVRWRSQADHRISCTRVAPGLYRYVLDSPSSIERAISFGNALPLFAALEASI